MGSGHGVVREGWRGMGTSGRAFGGDGTSRWLIFAAAVATMTTVTAVTVPAEAAARDQNPGAKLVASWSASASGAQPESAFTAKYTVRSVVRSAIGGQSVSVRLSNVFGDAPLTIGKVTLRPTDTTKAGAIKPVALTFAGKPGVTIKAGVRLASDVVRTRVVGGASYTVDVYVAKSPTTITRHGAARADTLIAPGVDRAGSPTNSGFTIKRPTRYLLNGLDIGQTKSTGAVVAFGDSITDGAASTPNADHRYPDYLNRLLERRGDRRPSVVNAGIGGNQLLTDSDGDGGRSGLNRFGASVAQQPGAKTVIALFGGNDLGADKPASAMIDGLTQLAAKARRSDIRVIGATVTPRGKSTWYTPEREKQRQLVNKWIRTTDVFHGYVDFDRALADPKDPKDLNPAYASQDQRHPNDAGYARMARAVYDAHVI